MFALILHFSLPPGNTAAVSGGAVYVSSSPSFAIASSSFNVGTWLQRGGQPNSCLPAGVRGCMCTHGSRVSEHALHMLAESSGSLSSCLPSADMANCPSCPVPLQGCTAANSGGAVHIEVCRQASWTGRSEAAASSRAASPSLGPRNGPPPALCCPTLWLRGDHRCRTRTLPNKPAQASPNVSVDASTFTGCRSAGNGGGFFVFNTPGVSVARSTFTNCSSTWGGGAYVWNAAGASMDRLTITGCTASASGGGSLVMGAEGWGPSCTVHSGAQHAAGCAVCPCISCK